MKSLPILIGSLIFIMMSCQTEKKDSMAETELLNKRKKDLNLNISILLDLSDRIDTVKYRNETMEFYERDIKYIQSIAETFVGHLEGKKIRKMADKIALYFDPEPRNPKINKISKSLKFDVTRNNVTSKVFDDIIRSYKNGSREIYELSIGDGNYIGSDTWSFFKNKVKDFCIEEDSRNILIILSDGYMYHKNNLREKGNLTTYLTPQYIGKMRLNQANWQEKMEGSNFGFIPATENLQNLDVLVLGVNPSVGNVYEYDVIKTYWNDWFKKMDVGYYDVRKAELPSDMRKIIDEFLLKD